MNDKTLTADDMNAALDLVLSRLRELSVAFDQACLDADKATADNRDPERHSDLYYRMCHVYDMRGFVIFDALDDLTKLHKKGLMTGDIPASALASARHADDDPLRSRRTTLRRSHVDLAVGAGQPTPDVGEHVRALATVWTDTGGRTGVLLGRRIPPATGGCGVRNVSVSGTIAGTAPMVAHRTPPLTTRLSHQEGR